MLFTLFDISAKGQLLPVLLQREQTVIMKSYYKFLGQNSNTFDVKTFNSRLKVF